MITLRGGGGSLLPPIVIILRPHCDGGFGGASRTYFIEKKTLLFLKITHNMHIIYIYIYTMSGSGVEGLGGC